MEENKTRKQLSKVVDKYRSRASLLEHQRQKLLSDGLDLSHMSFSSDSSDTSSSSSSSDSNGNSEALRIESEDLETFIRMHHNQFFGRVLSSSLLFSLANQILK